MSSRFSFKQSGVASALLALLACGPADSPLGPSPKPELKHSLVIPRGALSQTVTITAEAFPTAGNSVSFSPEGLKFAVPATLRLNYGNCQSGTKPKAVVYTDDNLNIIQKLNSLDSPSSQKVQTDLNHFSRYAVAW